jgi:hypothetical protein
LFSQGRVSRLTAGVIIELYPEVLDPDYNPKRQKVNSFIKILIDFLFVSSH